MSIPKLKFLALFFVFFAVFWQITTSFYIKMLSAGRQDFPRAAGGAAGLPCKESLRLFQPQAEDNAFRGTLCQAAPHVAKNTKACGRALRKLAPQNGVSFMLCPATVRPRKENRGTFGGATVCPAPACLGKMATTLAARFLRGTAWRGHLFRHYAGRFASFVPTALRHLNNAPAGEAGTFEQLRAKVRLATMRPHLPCCLPMTCDDTNDTPPAPLARPLGAPRQRYNDTRPRIYIYISMLFCKTSALSNRQPVQKTATGAKKTPAKTSGAYPVYCFCTGEPQ